MTGEILSGLLAANLAAGLAILAVLALRGPVRRRFGAAMAYRLWLAPLAAGLAVFIPAPKGLAPTLPAAAIPQQVLLIFDPAVAPAAPLGAVVSSPAWSLPDLRVLLLAIWLIGTMAAVGLTFLAHRRGMRSFGRLKSTGARGPLRSARNGLGPALVGVIRPRLVLPADFEMRFSEREQALILAHERHHGQSGDPRINALAVLLGCLNWFNPLVHLAAFLLRVDQELACDAAVVGRFPGERRTYAEALLKSQQACIPMPLGCTWPGRSPKLLQERLTMLAHNTPDRARLLAGGVLVGALCLAAGAVAWAATASAPSPRQPVPAAAASFSATPGGRAAASAAPMAAPVEAVAPSTIGVACFSNSCGGQARPRDAAAVAAAIRIGDGKAVLANGGNATDLLAAWKVVYDRTADPNLRMLFEQMTPGSEMFVIDPRGSPAMSVDVADARGSGRMMLNYNGDMSGFDAPSSTPKSVDLDGFPRGTVLFTDDRGVSAYRAPDGTVLPPANMPKGSTASTDAQGRIVFNVPNSTNSLPAAPQVGN